jgi:PAS domain-containing protein
MRLLWDRAPGSLLRCSTQGRIIYVNACFLQKIMNIPNLTSLMLWDLVEGGDVPQVRSALLAAAHDGQLHTVNFQMLLLTLDKFPLHRECEANVIADSGDLVLSLVLSPQKRTDASEQVAEVLDYMVHAPIPLQMLSSFGHILWANKALLAMLEYTFEEYIGKHMTEFCTMPVPELHSKLEAMEKGLVLHNYQMYFVKKSGETVPILIDASLQMDKRTGKFRNSR